MTRAAQRRACSTVCVLALAFVCGEARAQDELETLARFVVTSGVGGHLGRPACENGRALEASHFAELTPALAELASAPDRPLLFDAGGLLTPGGVARFAVRDRPRELADALVAIGYRALVFGSAELGAPREPMIGVLAALRAHRVPAIATNLYCRPGSAATPLCDVLVDGSDGPSIFVVGRRRVALVSIVSRSALVRVAPDLADGVVLADEAEALADAVRRARRGGVDLVVASVEGAGDDPASAGLALASRLPEDARPDIVVIADAGDQLAFARPPSFTPAVVAPPPGGALRVRVRSSSATSGYDVLARPIAARASVAPPFDRWLERTGERYCREWGRRLAGATLDREMTGRDLLELAAAVVRDRASAELGVLNMGALDAAWSRPNARKLTASDVYVALQYDEPLVAADVSGAWLADLLGKMEEKHLVAPGLEGEATSLRVNGRPVDRRGVYRVVTIRFLGAGGDEALPPLPHGARWEPVEGASLRTAMLDFLDTPRDGDPRSAVEPLADALEWTFRVDGDVKFAGTAIESPTDASGAPVYDAAQLGRADSLSGGFALSLGADAVARLWSWENEGIVRQRTTRTATDEFAESDDVLSLRTTLVYRGLRAELPEPYVPQPYVEAYLESELTKPETRAFHHLLLRPTIGVRFTLFDELTLELGGGAARELLDSSATFQPGALMQLVLAPWTVLGEDARRLKLELLLDYFVTGSSQELRGKLDSSLTIAEPFALVVGVQLFGRLDNGQQLGVALDVTVGLRIDWLGRLGP